MLPWENSKSKSFEMAGSTSKIVKNAVYNPFQTIRFFKDIDVSLRVVRATRQSLLGSICGC